MEPKTKVHAENGKQELMITRDFDLPVDLLFKAYTDPEMIEEWMGSRAIKQENKKHGSWQLEKKDDTGKVLFGANGVFHEFLPDQNIIRTFEMDNTPFGPQLEFLEFEKINDEKSRLTIQIIYRSIEIRDQVLKMPFAQGINMAHNRLQEIVNKLK